MDETDRSLPDQSDRKNCEIVNKDSTYIGISGEDQVEGPPPRPFLVKFRAFKHLYAHECTICFERFGVVYYEGLRDKCPVDAEFMNTVNYLFSDSKMYMGDHFDAKHEGKEN